MLNSCLELNLEVIKKSDTSRYANGNNINLVNLGPSASLSIYKMTTSSGKYLEDISHAHIVSLRYKQITSARSSDELSAEFDPDHGRRKQELTNNENTTGEYHLRIMLKDVFGFAEYQEKATYGLG